MFLVLGADFFISPNCAVGVWFEHALRRFMRVSIVVLTLVSIGTVLGFGVLLWNLISG